ncbi:TRAP transporter substrate-binding protein [Paracoccus sp. N5]|uniref:TRAP transporter substrate-binding protein n=1 Tax=Paracoccus sp. N5 TaxID=1101189 RepID=UPI000369C91B|nr:TRAP transporter substrate-binding protein [Paracoccus sp. N5]
MKFGQVARRLSAAALMCGVAALSAQAREVTFRFHSFVHATSYQQVKFFEPWCKRIEEQSGGRMGCQIFPSMQLGGAPSDLFNQARDGIVDIAYGNPGYSPGSYLSAEVFELPFMMRDLHDAARGMHDYFTANPGPELAGLHLIAVAPADFPVIQTASKPIRKMEDLQGVKLRSAGRYGAKVLEALGALPVQMAAGEITDSLSRGVIDGAYLPWSAVSLLNLGSLMHHYTDFAEGQDRMYTSLQLVMMGQGTYDRLPDDLKKIIDENSTPETSAEFADAFASTANTELEALRKASADIYLLPEDEYERWRAAVAHITEDWIKDANAKGMDGQKMLDMARAAIAARQQ